MTASGLAAAQAVAHAFIDTTFPWLPKPAIVEWDNTAGGTRLYSTATSISVPKWSDAWDDGRYDFVIHEVGHVLAFYVSTRVPVIERFLATFGANAAFKDDPLVNEIFAEHFARAYVDGYTGVNYPQLVGLVPFDAAKMRAFCEALALAVPAGGQVAPVASTTPAGPAAPGLFQVIDIRAELPFDAANLPWPITSDKTSTTVHWPGGEFDVETDDDARNLIHAFAQEHIRKDWASEVPGVQGGAGLMYAEVIAPSGTVFITRDPDANLWHSNDPVGNTTSRPILVLCGADAAHAPTAAQLRSLRARILGLPTYPHSKWLNTQCPGAALRSFLAGSMDVEEDMDRPTFDAWFRENYEKYEVAKTFDDIKAIQAKQAHHKHQTGEPEAA
jgi:hypothetical protein